MTNGVVTVGPNGSVNADINAREVVVRGNVQGKITGRDKVQLWNTGIVTGEVQTDRLAIEDGATLRGKVEAGKSKNSDSTKAATTATGKISDAFSAAAGSSAD
jgi:cytoskeletal protein CcmA (bactofilin family)